MHLTVGAGLGALVDPLVEVLSQVPDDPFQAQLVAVPGEGVRSWLTWQLSQRLGGHRGVVAHVDWVFPSTIVTRALGIDHAIDPWGVDALTWAVHAALCEGRVADLVHHMPDLTRSRALADLFDRYGARRPGMVAAWERGRDIDAFGRPLPESQCWQPRLWRAVAERYGSASSAVRSFEFLQRLRDEGPSDQVPDHVVLVGVTAMPSFHLHVLAGLARHREVWLLSPVPSLDLWQRLGEIARRHGSGQDHLDLARVDDPAVSAARHPLTIAWGRASREAQYHLLASTQPHGVTVTALDTVPPQPHRNDSLLARLRSDLMADRPSSVLPIDPSDRSMRWHRCHGPARQAEVLRDVLTHLFEERDDAGQPRFEPRDVGVLCSDITVFGPLIQAACAGDPDQGVPAIPVRVADRTLGGEAPLVDVVEALCALFDRRWRRDDVMALLRLSAVSRRFQLGADDISTLSSWLDLAHVRWGLTADDHQRAGLPHALSTHNLQSGLDQLMVGASLPDGLAFGPGGVASAGGLEGDALDILGAFAEFVDRLAGAVDGLLSATTVTQWVSHLKRAVTDLAELPEDDAWQWGRFTRELDSFCEAAAVAGGDTEIDPLQLSDLVVAGLGSRSGRVRFDTGAVTVSSLAGQRGVPRRVVCLVGLDDDLMTTGVASVDDLVAAQPIVGDPDPRAELRAVLLDAVMAAEERLLLLSTGFDLRTNDELATSVALSELVEVIDHMAGGVQARHQWAIDHPRQSWSSRAFLPGALGEPGPFSFHRGALAMFQRSQQRRDRQRFLDGPLPAETGDIELQHIVTALDHPVQALLGGRCGLSLPDVSERPEQVIPITVTPLAASALRRDLLRAVLTASGESAATVTIDERLEVARRRGALPPLALGDPAAAELRDDISALLDRAHQLGAVLEQPRPPIEIRVPVPDDQGRWLVGRVDDVGPQQLLRLRSTRFNAAHLLTAWVELAAVTVAQPDQDWEAIVVARAATGPAVEGHLIRLVSAQAAYQVLAVAAQFTTRVRQSLLPVTGHLAYLLHHQGVPAAASAWATTYGPGSDRWMQWAVGDADFGELVDLPPWDDEHGHEWGTSPSRLQRWSHRLWSTYAATTQPSADGASGHTSADDDDGTGANGTGN